MPAVSPSTWPEAQHALHEHYLNDPSSLPRRQVRWRLYEETALVHGLQSRGAAFAGLAIAVKAIFRRRTNEAPVIAVWRADARPGDAAALVFEFAPRPSGVEGDAVLVGEAAANGALCLELATGEVVWPTYNPRSPANWVPRL